MSTITIRIDKGHVYNEAAKLTGYLGAKAMDADRGAYRRVALTDADRELLERYFAESCSEVTTSLSRWLVSVSDHPYGHGTDLGADYEIELDVQSSYDASLTPSVATSLTGYFVSSVASRWLLVSDPSRAEAVAAEAALLLEDVLRKLYWKKKPLR